MSFGVYGRYRLVKCSRFVLNLCMPDIFKEGEVRLTTVIISLKQNLRTNEAMNHATTCSVMLDGNLWPTGLPSLISLDAINIILSSCSGKV